MHLFRPGLLVILKWSLGNRTLVIQELQGSELWLSDVPPGCVDTTLVVWKLEAGTECKISSGTLEIDTCHSLLWLSNWSMLEIDSLGLDEVDIDIPSFILRSSRVGQKCKVL